MVSRGPGRTSANIGGTPVQTGIAFGHRLWNRHPCGQLRGLGVDPPMPSSRSRGLSIDGIAVRRYYDLPVRATRG